MTFDGMFGDSPNHYSECLPAFLPRCLSLHDQIVQVALFAVAGLGMLLAWVGLVGLGWVRPPAWLAMRSPGPPRSASTPPPTESDGSGAPNGQGPPASSEARDENGN